ncbi:large ribosomal subunit protein mL55 [Austrofundulus limnaeus]|uniref:Large ribosomal subunit protein mL55 n=1 Tax=Austrofundulus limnaeus TaxID=52670 RepID=A0A2I4BYR2_AUSLI|nr:PREDICTED: 39S ribosomal protein L55, mitochondrial [Austrofundulus limnaeus]
MANILFKKLNLPPGVLTRVVCPLLSRAGGSGSEVQQVSLLHSTANLHNSNKTSVVRFGRQHYERMYPVLLVRPDGSTVHIRYKEPRGILLMPVNLATLSEEERQARMKKRMVKTKETEEVIYEDDFKVDTYSHLWKKK